jgi:hypothetical protein
MSTNMTRIMSMRLSARRHLLPLLIVPLLVGASVACGQEREIADPWYIGINPKDTYEPDEVVLSIAESGGFMLAEGFATRLPIVVVYGDGRVLTPHRFGPAVTLSGLDVRRVDPLDLGWLIEISLAAGVGLDADLGTPPAFDLPDTVFEVSTDSGILSTSVFALGFDEGLPAEQIDARRRLIDLVDQLRDLPAILGAERVGPEEPYEPETLAVISRPWPGDGAQADPERAWPGPALPGQPLPMNPMIGPDDLTCLTVAGAELDAILDAADGASQETPWVWEGQRYDVWLRPLLPDESSCDDI